MKFYLFEAAATVIVPQFSDQRQYMSRLGLSMQTENRETNAFLL